MTHLVRVKFNGAGKWQDRPYDPQFEVEKDEELDLRPEFAAVVVAAGRGEVVEVKQEQPAKKGTADKKSSKRTPAKDDKNAADKGK